MPNRSMIVAQLSDPHIVAPGEVLYGRVDTAGFLARAVAEVNRLEPLPDVTVITGDLAAHGDPAEYAHLRRILAPLRMPVFVIPGNNDAREPAFLMAVAPGASGPKGTGLLGVALLDLSTGEFSAAEYAGDEGLQTLSDELAVLRPREIIAPRNDNGATSPALRAVERSGLPMTPVDPWTFELESAGQEQALRSITNLPNPNDLYLRIVEEMYEPEAVEARLAGAGLEASEDGT